MRSDDGVGLAGSAQPTYLQHYVGVLEAPVVRRGTFEPLLELPLDGLQSKLAG
jgi:hypothetical protein